MIANFSKTIKKLTPLAFLLALVCSCGGGYTAPANEAVVRIENAALPEQTGLGLKTPMSFTLNAREAVQNVYVYLTLYRTNTNGIPIDAGKYPVAAVHIPRMEAEEVLEKEASFIMPRSIPVGNYLSVFEVTVDDPSFARNGNVDLSNDSEQRCVIRQKIEVVEPDKPALELGHSSLNNNSIALSSHGPAEEKTENNLKAFHDLILNQEFESYGHDLTEPLEFRVDLEIPGQNPIALKMLKMDENGQPTLLDIQSIPNDHCQEEGDQEEGRCVSVFAGFPAGITLDLHYPAEVWEKLPDEEVTCYLAVHMDPNRNIAVYKGDREKMVKRLPIQFLINEAQSQAPEIIEAGVVRRPHPRRHDYFNLDVEKIFGNDNFRVGGKFLMKASYYTAELDDAVVPEKFLFYVTPNIPLRIAVIDNYALKPFLKLEYLTDPITDSFFQLEVKTWMDLVLWEYKKNIAGAGETVLWTSQDENGDEQFSKSAEIHVDATFTIGPIPVSAGLGAVGTIGFKGDVTGYEDFSIVAEAGPFAELDASAELAVGVDDVLAFGIEGKLKLIELDQWIKAEGQLDPSFTFAYIGISNPTEISSLDGSLSLYVDVVGGHYTTPLADWEGVDYTFDWSVLDAAGLPSYWDFYAKPTSANIGGQYYLYFYHKGKYAVVNEDNTIGYVSHSELDFAEGAVFTVYNFGHKTGFKASNGMFLTAANGGGGGFTADTDIDNFGHNNTFILKDMNIHKLSGGWSQSHALQCPNEIHYLILDDVSETIEADWADFQENCQGPECDFAAVRLEAVDEW